ncbi:hypothetical protein Srufu_068720 [Streptomyces libani subsp. rufus]|nr:hypothetical protein Srufu_068720 [Streptomyces libani subsp. rufus]
MSTQAGARKVALLFPGQGAQHPRMGVGLYGESSTFTAIMDRAFEAFGPAGEAIRDDWLAEDPSPLFDDISRAQPLLYAVNYALGSLLLESGVEPDALLGHSVGELVAATLGGVFDFESGLRYLQDFVRIYQRAPRGGMLAVAATQDIVTPYLRDDVVIGAINATRQLLLSGSDPSLSEVEASLKKDGFTCARARALQPFHSPVMKAMVDGYGRHVTRPVLRPPRVRLYSAYTGNVLDDETAMNWDFWVGQPVRPVLFGPTLQRLLTDRDHILVEAGPGQSLTALAKRTAPVATGRSLAIPALPARPGEPDADRETFTTAVEQLRAHGRATTIPVLST